jgi:hypothetical protein
MPERETKSDDKDPLELLRLANLKLRPMLALSSVPALPYYERHPEHRPRRLSRRQIRRRLIRGE